MSLLKDFLLSNVKRPLSFLDPYRLYGDVGLNDFVWAYQSPHGFRRTAQNVFPCISLSDRVVVIIGS